MVEINQVSCLITRFKTSDVPSNISKGAPDFCSVWIVSKGKVQSVRNAVRAAPTVSPLRTKIQSQSGVKPAAAAAAAAEIPMQKERTSIGHYPRGLDSTRLRWLSRAAEFCFPVMLTKFSMLSAATPVDGAFDISSMRDESIR